MPSLVAVPLPNSSRTTSEWEVAWWSIELQSRSSVLQVLCPVRMESRAPMRTKMASTGVSSQEMAGTLAPIWARIVARQTCLMTVLLPPMLGPVRRAKLLAPPRWMSLGTKLHPPEGWERPSAPKAPLSASISLRLHRPLPDLVVLAKLCDEASEVFENCALNLLLCRRFCRENFSHLARLVPPHGLLSLPLGGELPVPGNVRLLRDFPLLRHPLDASDRPPLLTQIVSELGLHLVHLAQVLPVGGKVRAWNDFSVLIRLGPIELLLKVLEGGPVERRQDS